MLAKTMVEVDLDLVDVEEKDRSRVIAEKFRDAVMELIYVVKTRLGGSGLMLGDLEPDHSFVIWVEKYNFDVYLFGAVFQNDELVFSRIPLDIKFEKKVSWILDPKF